jgi:transposase
MEKQCNTVCGADIHKKFLIATMLFRDCTKITKRFGMALNDLLIFKNWVIENGCEQVAVESTGTYWVPIYTIFGGDPLASLLVTLTRSSTRLETRTT